MSAAPGGSAPADARLRSMPHLDRRQRFHGATTANRTWYGAVVVNCIARRQPMHPRSPARETTLRDYLLIEEVRFAADSPLEGRGFELSVPLQKPTGVDCPGSAAAGRREGPVGLIIRYCLARSNRC